jgi:hypothetical protein
MIVPLPLGGVFVTGSISALIPEKAATGVVGVGLIFGAIF